MRGVKEGAHGGTMGSPMLLLLYQLSYRPRSEYRSRLPGHRKLLSPVFKARLAAGPHRLAVKVTALSRP